MVKNLKYLIFSILIILLSITPVKADLYDELGILTDEEESYIQGAIDEYEATHKYNVIVKFLDGYNDIELEMNSWYNYNYNSLEYKDSIIYAINMDQRETLIKAYDGLDFLNFYDDSGIVNETASFLTIEDYEGSINYLLENLPKEISQQKFIKIGLIFLINLIVFNLILFLCSRTYGQKDTTVVSTYMNPNSRITSRRDIFLRKTVTKTKKSSSSSGGGHSSGRGGRGHF